MLCFLPPVAATPRESRRTPPIPVDPSALVGAVIVVVGSLALLFPIGCVRPLPVYTARVGDRIRLGPRPIDRELLPQLDRAGAANRGSPSRRVFFASRATYGAGDAPPGTMIEAATGALVGIPAMAGSYTVALGVSDGTAKTVTGPAFMIKVLPSSAGPAAPGGAGP